MTRLIDKLSYCEKVQKGLFQVADQKEINILETVQTICEGCSECKKPVQLDK